MVIIAYDNGYVFCIKIQKGKLDEKAKPVVKQGRNATGLM